MTKSFSTPTYTKGYRYSDISALGDPLPPPPAYSPASPGSLFTYVQLKRR